MTRGDLLGKLVIVSCMRLPTQVILVGEPVCEALVVR